jgi:hypothetical protein
VARLSDEKLECLDHSVSRLARLKEMGGLWIGGGGCYALALWLEIFSRKCIAKHIAVRRRRRRRPASPPPPSPSSCAAPLPPVTSELG